MPTAFLGFQMKTFRIKTFFLSVVSSAAITVLVLFLIGCIFPSPSPFSSIEGSEHIPKRLTPEQRQIVVTSMQKQTQSLEKVCDLINGVIAGRLSDVETARQIISELDEFEIECRLATQSPFTYSNFNGDEQLAEAYESSIRKFSDAVIELGESYPNWPHIGELGAKCRQIAENLSDLPILATDAG